MKKLLIRLALFLLPLPLYIGIIILTDSFNYFGVSDWISEDTKVNTSMKLNYELWKMLEFKEKRCSKIILGDSRSHKINADRVKDLTDSEYYNFAYPGGTLVDMIETFWYANDLVKLEEVYMGINFNLYNDFEKNNDVKQAKSIMNNIFSYSFSKVVLTAMIQNILYQYFTDDLKIGVPRMRAGSFWDYQINVIGKRFYQKYRHPDTYYTELLKISDYCRKNDIKLVFFTPPNHMDWQRRVADYKLEEENKVFLDEISRMGKLYNLDVPNKFTENRENFYDPLHPVTDSVIVYALWGNERIE